MHLRLGEGAAEPDGHPSRRGEHECCARAHGTRDSDDGMEYRSLDGDKDGTMLLVGSTLEMDTETA